MSSTTAGLAARVMKARGDSICPRCKCPAGVGVLIGLVPGTGWCHVRPCIVGGKAPMIGPSNEPGSDSGDGDRSPAAGQRRRRPGDQAGVEAQ